VLIYFDTQTQSQVLARFWESLHPDGFLVLGPQDGMDQAARQQGFVPLQAGTTIYRKGPGARSA
jgi:chemotaxis protein methyltransferase CheR